MEKADLDLIQYLIELKATQEAQRLGVVFEVKPRIVDSCLNVLVRMKAGNEHNTQFADYIGKLIIELYRCDVRFTYPTKLKGCY